MPYCEQYTDCTPVWSVNAPTALAVLSNGKGNPFFLLPVTFINNSTMKEEQKQNAKGVQAKNIINPLYVDCLERLKYVRQAIDRYYDEVRKKDPVHANSMQGTYQEFDSNINSVACDLASMANMEFLETVYFSKEKEGVE